MNTKTLLLHDIACLLRITAENGDVNDTPFMQALETAAQLRKDELFILRKLERWETLEKQNEKCTDLQKEVAELEHRALETSLEYVRERKERNNETVTNNINCLSSAEDTVEDTAAFQRALSDLAGAYIALVVSGL